MSSSNQLQPSKTCKGASAIQTLSSGVLCKFCKGPNCTGFSGVMHSNTKLTPAAQRQCQLQSQPINIFTLQRDALFQLQNQRKSIGRQNTTGSKAKYFLAPLGGVKTVYDDGQEIFFFYMLMNIEALRAPRPNADK